MTSIPRQTVELVEVDYDPFEGGELSRVVPASEPQRELWLATRLGEQASLAFNEASSFRFRGRLDIPALEKALSEIVARHDALRASFGAEGETFCVLRESGFSLAFADLSALPQDQRDAGVLEARRRSVETPFLLEKGQLFRAELLRLAADEHLLILAAHHIVCDGWSWWVIVRELGTLYSHHHDGTPHNLPPAESYADYALDEVMHSQGPEFQSDEAYWLSKFAGEAPVLDLPTDHPRLARRGFASLREDYVLDAELVSAIRRMGARRGASLFATLLGGCAGLLSRITGQDDIVIGIPAAGQSVDGHDDLVGHCVNLLPLRFSVDASRPFSLMLDDARTTLLDAIEHQRYTFGTLLKKLPINREANRLPLVSVLFNIDQTMDQENAGFSGLQVEASSNPRSNENFELFINAVQTQGALVLECQYHSELFDAATIRRWLAGYEALLRAAVSRPDDRFADLPILDAAASAELGALQPSPQAYDSQCLMHEHFERRCDMQPLSIAVRCGDEALSFADLEARANRIAHLLRAQGVHRGALVGLALDRSIDMLAGLLGILKAGAGYVPLDPQFPAERLAYMAGDAGLAALITQHAHAAAFDLRGRPVLVLDGLVNELATAPTTRIGRDEGAGQPENAAYVIYTSGSTGRPKGVQVPHRAVANFLESMAREPGMHADDRLLAVTTLSFDIAVLELMLPLLIGAQVILAEKDEAADGNLLKELLASSGATVMQATPATWRMLIESGWEGDSSFKALCGGEPLPPDLAVQMLARCGQLWNLYGPTETTVWSTCMQVLPPAQGGMPDIHIGRPIANTQIWIVDEQGNLCLRGVPGEICIGGDGVTLGYLGRPDLTEERFVQDRFAQGPHASATTRTPLYRTGDRGRWRADGMLEHLGRLDFQVKVRGYRIELGEIESNIAAHPGVARVVVLAREDQPGDVRLVAYVVPQADVSIEEAALLAHVKAQLPNYMVPQHLVMLDAIPLLPNGKIDRKAFPPPVSRRVADVVVPLATEVSQQDEAHVVEDPRVGYLVGVWSEVLGTQARPDDNFFDLGGHSMLAVQMANRVAKDTGVRLRLLSLATQTLAQAASMLPQQESATATPAVMSPVQETAGGWLSSLKRLLGKPDTKA